MWRRRAALLKQCRLLSSSAQASFLASSCTTSTWRAAFAATSSAAVCCAAAVISSATAATTRCDGGTTKDIDDKAWLPPPILHGHAAPGGGKKREYHFKQKLGAGVNGVAAEYEDQSNHKSVAIKFSKAHAAPAERNAFAVSQRINPKLSYLHNLSPAYELLELPAEAGVKSGVATIWGWGGERTVWDAMQKPDWTPDNADTALACILRALLKLHQEGHLHGDLHAENVMVHQTRKKGITVNLIDFGNCLKIEGGWTKWPYAVKDENKDKGPAYGSTQFPPELWCSQTKLEKGPSNAQTLTWKEMLVKPSLDVWAAGMIYYDCVVATGVVGKQQSAHSFQKEIADSVQLNDGDVVDARDTLNQMLEDFPPRPAKLLKMMLEPDPSMRAFSYQISKVLKEKVQAGDWDAPP